MSYNGTTTTINTVTQVLATYSSNNDITTTMIVRNIKQWHDNYNHKHGYTMSLLLTSVKQ